jgi:hypothetical protein
MKHGNTHVFALDINGVEGFSEVSLSEAKKKGAYIATCAYCELYAVELDHLAPYHQENNRCIYHKHPNEAEAQEVVN